MSDDIVRDEVTVITDFIKRKEHPTIKDLQNYMEQLFADMLNEFLVQFPNAIYREITECHLEEYEEKVRMALKLICRVQPLEKKIQWSFPTGTNITALVTSDQDLPTTDTTSNNNSPDTGSASDNHAGSSRPPSPQVINKDSSHEDGTSHNT
ncbi:hypothetical protein Scep_010871 [Stephania cephalantha]|uniref:Uncharacterized protein n=1 Tax=Stephania cephalantha TaxID=152367 RepID=A0AAP0PHG4_9MAGN